MFGKIHVYNRVLALCKSFQENIIAEVTTKPQNYDYQLRKVVSNKVKCGDFMTKCNFICILLGNICLYI